MGCSSLISCTLSLTCFLGLGEVIAQASDDAILSQAVASWQHRQSLVKSAHFELTMRQRIPKGAYTKPAKRGDATAIANPPKDVSLDWKQLFLFDADKMRWESDRPRVMAPDWTPTTKTYIATFNGEVSKSLTKAAGETSDSGSIREEKGVPEAEAANVRPLMYAFRPFHQASKKLARDRLTVLRDRPMVEGRPCVAVKSRGIDSPETILWIDPSLGYSVVREYIAQQDKVLFDITVTYTEQPDCGWMPVAWKATSFQPSGTVRNYLDVAVSNFKINPQLPAEAFEVTFPIGALVHDERERREAVVNPDGELETVVEWASAEPSRPAGGERIWLLVGGIGGMLLAVLCVLHIRRRSKRSM